MTNVSVYAYKDVEEYMKLYPAGQDKLVEDHLSSLWINKKSIAFVSDSHKGVSGYRPDFSKSVIYFSEGEELWLNKYSKDWEPITGVQYKNGNVIFSGDEVEHKLFVAKYVGDKENGFVQGYILYDESRDRLNIIMESAPLPTV